MTMRVIVDDDCLRCDAAHKVEVLSWTEDGKPGVVRQIEPCPQDRGALSLSVAPRVDATPQADRSGPQNPTGLAQALVPTKECAS